jgi:hypothetical protein
MSTIQELTGFLTRETSASLAATLAAATATRAGNGAPPAHQFGGGHPEARA